jgi:copper chaperone CopZ
VIFLGETEKLKLRVLGVSCATCIIPIRRTLEKTEGIKSIGSNYLTENIFVEYDSKIIGEKEIIKRIDGVGYQSISIR